MKIGFFTDPHYCDTECLLNKRYPYHSFSRVREAMETFVNESCEAVFCLGDLIDRTPKQDRRCPTDHDEALSSLREIMELIHSFGLPFYLVPGNHDYLDLVGHELLEIAKAPEPPYTMETAQHLLVILDANYRDNFQRFDVAGVEWTDAWLPRPQMEFLSQQLDKSQRIGKPVVIIVHENLDPFLREDHQIRNGDMIRDMLTGSLLSSPKKLLLVIQGHYHPGVDHTTVNIRYLTLPAMCEGDQNPYLILEL